jgi:membrane-bound inhibitor of C-type lysozyme
MKLPSRTLIAFMFTLAGCAAAADHTSPTSQTTWTRYACSDGQVVQASYPDTQTAQVKIKGETHTLHVVISGSGARYTGDSWQWWTKGMHQGMLAPLAAGETIASAPGVICHD